MAQGNAGWSECWNRTERTPQIVNFQEDTLIDSEFCFCSYLLALMFADPAEKSCAPTIGPIEERIFPVASRRSARRQLRRERPEHRSDPLADERTGGFVPRSADDLDTITGAAFGTPLDYAMVLPGLLAVARALDAGDMTRAIFATQFMRLPALTEAQAQRAMAAERLIKAADDEDHPGYPAGEPGGKGGQFRPKDDAAGGDGGPIRPVDAANRAGANEEAPAETQKTKSMKSPAVKRALGGVARRVAQVIFEKVLSPSRIGRFLAELGSNFIPGLDIIGDAMLVKDVADVIEAVEQAASEGETAAEFAEAAPTLTSVRVSETSEQFASFDRFKKDYLVKRFGSAGDGFEYHHIVEQNDANAAQFTAEQIHSTDNIVRIPKAIHTQISAEYSRKVFDGGPRLRYVIREKPFDEQYQFGVNVLKRHGLQP